jgi:hypothetical protein
MLVSVRNMASRWVGWVALCEIYFNCRRSDVFAARRFALLLTFRAIGMLCRYVHTSQQLSLSKEEKLNGCSLECYGYAVVWNCQVWGQAINIERNSLILLNVASCRAVHDWNQDSCLVTYGTNNFVGGGEKTGLEFLWAIFLVSLERLNYRSRTS